MPLCFTSWPGEWRLKITRVPPHFENVSCRIMSWHLSNFFKKILSFLKTKVAIELCIPKSDGWFFLFPISSVSFILKWQIWGRSCRNVYYHLHIFIAASVLPLNCVAFKLWIMNIKLFYWLHEGSPILIKLNSDSFPKLKVFWTLLKLTAKV